MFHFLRTQFAASRAAPLACFALSVGSSAAQQTWTVDDDGPADFTSIAAAVIQVAAGDVLLVQPGSYAGFNLDKSLSILGPATGPKPIVTGWSNVVGASHLLFAGLQFNRLTLKSIAGRAQLDDCVFPIMAGQPGGESKLEIRECAEVVVSRCTAQGSVNAGLFGSSGALFAKNSSLSMDECEFRGGEGSDGFQDGQDAVRIESSTLLVAGSTLLGGHGGQGGLCTSCKGSGGSGLNALNSLVTIRGSGADLLKVGKGGSTPSAGLLATNCSVVASGALIATHKLVNSSMFVPGTAEPFATLGGDDALARRYLLRGPAGAPGIVVVASAGALAALPGLEGLVWLDPASIVFVHPMVTQGQSTPSSWLLQLPPLAALTGVTFWLQAGFPTLPGSLDPNSLALTNPVQLVLRF